jgi:hypothetical protein
LVKHDSQLCSVKRMMFSSVSVEEQFMMASPRVCVGV